MENDSIFRYGFKLQKYGQVLVFEAESEEDKAKWMHAFDNKVIKHNILGEYRFSQKIGKGSFGKVFLAQRATQKQ